MQFLDKARRLKTRIVSNWQQRNWIPAWTSAEEQRYLTTYAAQDYRGAGEIVDLGCLLGATTLALAKGLQSNAEVARKAKRIHAYDRFEWEESFNTLPGGFSRSYQPHENFFSEFELRTSRFADYIQAYNADLTKTGWHGAPIEFLLVDANKSWELCQSMGKNFYPHLLVGESLVFDQDFKHYYTPWVHILNYRLRQALRPYNEVAGTCSFVFRPIKQIDAATVPSAAEMQAIGTDELDEVYEFSLSLIRNGAAWEKANVSAAKVMFYIHLDRMAEARAVLDDVLSKGFTIDSDLKVCARLIESASPLA